MRKYIIGIICFEVLIIVFHFIQSSNKKILGVSTLINKENFKVYESGRTKYFYEPNYNGSKRFIEKASISKDTLNERFDYAEKKEQGTIRIVTLGDSFTFGVGVSTKDNWSEQLEDMLNKACLNAEVEVINLGVPGYDTSYAHERFNRRGLKYNPDLLIWMVVDFERVMYLMQEWQLKYESELKRDGLSEEERIVKVKENYLNARQNILDDLGKEYVNNYNLNSIRNLLLSFDKDVLLLHWSRDVSIVNKLNKIKSENKNLNLVDFSNIFLNRKELIIPGDSHPNEKGHKEIAKFVLNFIMTSKIIEC